MLRLLFGTTGPKNEPQKSGSRYQRAGVFLFWGKTSKGRPTLDAGKHGHADPLGKLDQFADLILGEGATAKTDQRLALHFIGVLGIQTKGVHAHHRQTHNDALKEGDGGHRVARAIQHDRAKIKLRLVLAGGLRGTISQ